MTTFAAHLARVLPHHRFANAHILAMRYRSEVLRIHASPIAAEVVDLAAGADRTYPKTKSNAMCLLRPGAVPKLAVAGRLPRAVERPAAVQPHDLGA